MTPQWTDIRFSKRDQPYILVGPSPAQQRRKGKRHTVGFAGRVARFISQAVERTAHAAYNAMLAAEELSRFVRHQLHMFGSDEGEAVGEGRLRGKPLKARSDAELLAHQFHGPPREVRGET